MVRLLIIFAIAAIIAVPVTLLVDNPGQVTIDWMGYRLETAMSLMALFLFVVFLLVLLALRVIKLVLGGPAAWRRFFGDVRARQGMGALTQGLAAAAAGDASEARRHAITAERLAREGPLAQVLALEAAELEGRTKDVSVLARGLLEQPETALLGHRALFDLARKVQDEDTAVDEAEAAFEKHPAAGWAAEAILADAIGAQDWARAKSIYGRADRFGGFINGRSGRIKATMLYAEATQLHSNGESSKALNLARKSMDADPTFAPAPILTAEIYGQEGKIKRAQKSIEDAWSALPHPVMGRIYAELFPGERQVETLGRLRALISLNAKHTESRLLFAMYAIAARNFMAGRDALKGLLMGEGSARAFAAMAMLDRAEQGMAEASEDWMAKALAAPRDAVWVCTSCGHVHGEWNAICGRCTGVGTMEWATHLAPVGPRDDATVEMDPSIGLEVTSETASQIETDEVEISEPEKIEGPAAEDPVEGSMGPELDTPAPFEEGLRQPDDPGPRDNLDTDKEQKGKGEVVW